MKQADWVGVASGAAVRKKRKAYTLTGKVVRVGDVLKTPGSTDSRYTSVVSRIDDDGLVQFHGEDYHRYGTEDMVHEPDPEKARDAYRIWRSGHEKEYPA